MNLQKHKKAWADFEEWVNNFIHHHPCKYFFSVSLFKALPFEMQLGVYLKYFEESPHTGYIYGAINGMQGWVQIKDWKEIIEQAFKIREEQLK